MPQYNFILHGDLATRICTYIYTQRQHISFCNRYVTILKKKSPKSRNTGKRQTCHAGKHSDAYQPASQPTNDASKQKNTKRNIAVECDTVWSSISVPIVSRKTAAFVIRMGKLLQMILVRNQIRNMLGGETGKITFGKLSKNLGFPAKSIPSWYSILVYWRVRTLRLL